MTPRERVLTSLSHEEPDRVPVHVDFVRSVTAKLSETLGCPKEEVGLRLGNDMVVLRALSFVPAMATEVFEEYTDEWGIVWKRKGLYYERSNFPLAATEDLSSLVFPDPLDPGRYRGLEGVIERYMKDYVIVGTAVISVFERAWWLRGMSRFMEDMLLNGEYAHELLERSMDFSLRCALKLLDLGVDVIWFGDDVGMQKSMLISPELWREYLKPRYARMIARVKEKNPRVLVAYHSDGYVEPIIDEMVEMGLDILNPVQPACMDPAGLKKRYGRNLAFWGTMDLQHTLPFGSPRDVEEEVNLRVRTVGRGGGLILSPSHHVQADVSLDNIFAFYTAAKGSGGKSGHPRE